MALIGRLVLLLLLLAPVSRVLAWEAESRGWAPAPDEAARVDLSHARELFGYLETWLAQGDASTAAAPIWASDTAGLKVTLRLGGMTLAAAQQWMEPIPIKMDPRDTLGRPVVNLAELGRQAVQTALDQLAQQVRTSALSATQGINPMRDLGPRLLVDLQIARCPRPVLIPSTDPDASVVFAFVPGFHGLLLTSAQARENRSVLWPASAVAENLAPLAQVHQLLRGLGLPETELSRIGRPAPAGAAGAPALPLARFEILHLVRPSWHDPPLEMVRGQELLPAAPATSATLESMAQRMTDFLVTRVRQDGQAAGVYLPATDRWESEVATWPETALLAYALSQRMLWLQIAHGPELEPARLREALRRLLAYLQPPDGSAGPAQRDPATAALFLLTLDGLRQEPWVEPWLPAATELAGRLRRLQLPGGGFASQFAARHQPAGLPLHALILAALAIHADRAGLGEWHQAMRAELDRLWKERDPGPLAAAMPWLAAAEFALRETDGAGAAQPLEEARVQRLLALAKKLRSQLIRQPPPLGPADCVGGFDVTPRSPESAPYPDWRASQFLAFWALALAEPEFGRGPDALPWLVDCGLAARFLGQLMYRESATFAVRQPGEVLGGVRLSLWDNRLGAPATSMSLLAITRLQQALGALRKMQP